MLKFGKKKGDKAPKDDATAVAAAPAADGEGEGAPKKKKMPLLFIVIPAAVLVLGGGGGAAFYLMQPKAAAADDAAEGKVKKKEAKSDKKKGDGEPDPALGVIKDGPDGVTFYTLPNMVMNVQSADGRPTFLQLKLTLEMQDHDVALSLQEQTPRMQDMFQGFLREVRPEELNGSAGSYQLRAEILRRVNLVAAPGEVDAVLIEEMLVK